jgi:DNA mismatch repair protein MutS2
LVLLDEVGAGTDPKQGEALAMSLIEEFNELKSYLMLTTHYDNLKTYAIETDYIKVCAMDFDKLTLKPTYKMIENTIGKSYAFEIAKQYGISEKIINRADEYKEKYSNVNERALKKLEEEMDKYEVLKEENKLLKKELNAQIEINKQKEKNLNDLIKDVQDKAEEEKERLIKESVEKIEEILYEIRNKDNLKMHEALKAKKALEDLTLKEEEERSNAVFQIGDHVYVSSLNTYGTITRKNKDVYGVDVGSMTITVKNKDLEKREKNKVKPKVFVSNRVKLAKVSNEVNLIGMNRDEALYELKQFLDKARVINLSPVRIIHGFGEGILRKMVNDYLKKCDFVESYTLAGYGSGSGGATMVYLKKRNNA